MYLSVSGVAGGGGGGKTGLSLEESYWRMLINTVGSLVGRSRPDAVVVNYALHYTGVGDFCSPHYALHVSKCLKAVRSVYPGLLVWHPGYLTQFEDQAPFGVVSPNQAPPPWPVGSRKVSSLWNCRSRDQIYSMEDSAREVAARYGVHVLNSLHASAAFPQNTDDNRHYNGGVLNHMHQKTSITVLNMLLNLISPAAELR